MNFEPNFLIHRFDPAPDSSPVWLQNINCELTDTTVKSYLCTYDGLGVADCPHTKVAAVSCLAGEE